MISQKSCTTLFLRNHHRMQCSVYSMGYCDDWFTIIIALCLYHCTCAVSVPRFKYKHMAWSACAVPVPRFKYKHTAWKKTHGNVYSMGYRDDWFKIIIAICIHHCTCAVPVPRFKYKHTAWKTHGNIYSMGYRDDWFKIIIAICIHHCTCTVPVPRFKYKHTAWSACT